MTENTKTQSDNGVPEDLLSFRTTWLRAVACASNDPVFRTNLLHPLPGQDAATVIEEIRCDVDLDVRAQLEGRPEGRAASPVGRRRLGLPRGG